MGGHKIEILPEYLMIYRLHDKQITETTLEKQRTEIITVQKNYFAKLLEPMNEEAEEFLIDRMALVVNSVKEVWEFFEEEGLDMEGMSKEEDILEACEVFVIGDGRFLIVEA